MRRLRWLLTGLCFFAAAQAARAQVSPAEITNPQLKAAETDYYPQIMTLYHAINGLKPPFPLQLSRYVGLDPSRQAETDSRGVEFVYFQDRLLLKISANYNAAYSAERLTQNQRASRTFSDVIAPILSLVAKQIPEDVACDGIGFEIAYHVRTASQNFDYEGKEILVVVFDRADAFAFAGAGSDSGRQEILNHSQIYLDGKEFGLALGQENLSTWRPLARRSPPKRTARQPRPDTPPILAAGSTLVNPKLLPPRAESTMSAARRPRPGEPGAELRLALPGDASGSASTIHAGNLGGCGASAIPIPNATRCPGQHGTSQVSLCGLCSALLCHVPKPGRVANDAAKYAPLLARFRLDL